MCIRDRLEHSDTIHGRTAQTDRRRRVLVNWSDQQCCLNIFRRRWLTPSPRKIDPYTYVRMTGDSPVLKCFVCKWSVFCVLCCFVITSVCMLYWRIQVWCAPLRCRHLLWSTYHLPVRGRTHQVCYRLIIHRESKRRHYTLVHIFAKYWPIFLILSPTHSVGNLQ